MANESDFLVDTTVAFFTQCTGEYGELPKQFKTGKFWRQQPDLPEKCAEGLRRWAALSSKHRQLVCESVEADTDTYIEGKDAPVTPEAAASYALDQLALYMAPDVLAELIAAAEPAQHQHNVGDTDEGFLARLGQPVSSQGVMPSSRHKMNKASRRRRRV